MRDSKKDKVYGCLNCGHQHSETNTEVGSILYCKDCDKYEQIVHISETGISTSERLEKHELFQLLNEGRLKIVDNNDIRNQNYR